MARRKLDEDDESMKMEEAENAQRDEAVAAMANELATALTMAHRMLLGYSSLPDFQVLDFTIIDDTVDKLIKVRGY